MRVLERTPNTVDDVRHHSIVVKEPRVRPVDRWLLGIDVAVSLTLSAFVLAAVLGH